MAKFYREITPELLAFIRRQKLFFTGTAPSDGARVNISPKGYASLAILDPTTVCYADLPGSGNETANHIRDNGRLTLMWCSFNSKPLILRVYCQAEVIAKTDPRFADWAQTHFARMNQATLRQIILGHVEAVQTSCGYGVPLYEYQGDRPLLNEWAENKLAQGKLQTYIAENGVRNDVKFSVVSPRSAGSEE